jgi:hypothetical protein
VDLITKCIFCRFKGVVELSQPKRRSWVEADMDSLRYWPPVLFQQIHSFPNTANPKTFR